MTDTDETATLAFQRENGRGLVADLEEAADALRLVLTGTADADAVRTLRSHIDGYGRLVVEKALNWDLLIRHSGAPSEGAR